MTKQDLIRLCRASRKAQNITLQELSIKFNVSPATLSLFEHGRFNWDIAHAYLLNVLNEAEKHTYFEIYKNIMEG